MQTAALRFAQKIAGMMVIAFVLCFGLGALVWLSGGILDWFGLTAH